MADPAQATMDLAWKAALVVIGLAQAIGLAIWNALTKRIERIEATVRENRQKAADGDDRLDRAIDGERMERERKDEQILARLDGKLDQLRESQASTAHELRDALHQIDKKLTALGG